MATNEANQLCFICKNSKSHRFLKLDNSKCRREIIPKLFYILNRNSFGSVDPVDKYLCSSCVQKIDSSFSFMKIVSAIFNSSDVETPSTSSCELDLAAYENVLALDHTYSQQHHDAEIHIMKDDLPTSSPRNMDIITAKKLMQITNIRNGVEQILIGEVNATCSSLTSRKEERSVLSHNRTMEKLSAESETLIPQILSEISSRMPFLYEMLLAIAGIDKKSKMKGIPAVASAYSVLLHQRNTELSAYQRLTSAICLEGHLTDEGFTRMNQLGLTLSAKSKLRIQDECGDIPKKTIATELKRNPLVKVIGDNLDIYIKTAHERRSKSNSDLHMFASNLVFSRVAKPDMSNDAPAFVLDNITPESLLLNGEYKTKMRNAYIFHLSKLLVELPAFEWLRKVVPKMKFPYEREMCEKTTRFFMPIQHKNENKLEECCDIMDHYEEYLNGAFHTAFGEGANTLREFKAVVGGDQLTRVRLQEAKHLLSIAVDPKRRFEDLNPIVVEMWHNKQDLLEKAYKTLFNVASARQPGTLYHAKSILQRGAVNGKVKSRFKAHHDLFMTLGRVLLKEHLMEFLGMESPDSAPTKIISTDDFDRGRRWMTQEEKSCILYSLVSKFLENFNYLDFDAYMGPSITSTSDSVYNYCSNLCHWFLQVLEMDDTAKAGDITRVIPNCMNAIPLFFSHSRLSKYFVENIDYILKCEFLLSPLQRLRVLEGSFVNLRGGANNNMEADLMQENSVRVVKNLIKQLGANKTTSAIDRTSAAAETIKAVTDGLDCFINSRTISSKHKIASSFNDEQILARSVRQLRPFRVEAGRNCVGFKAIHASPFERIDLLDFRQRVDQVVRRLTYDQAIVVDDDNDEDSSSSDED